MEQLEMAFRLSRELTKLLDSQKTTQKESNLEDLVSTAPVHVDTKESTFPCQVTVTGATSNSGESPLKKDLDKFYETATTTFRKQKSELNFVKFCKKEEDRIYEKYQD